MLRSISVLSTPNRTTSAVRRASRIAELISWDACGHGRTTGSETRSNGEMMENEPSLRRESPSDSASVACRRASMAVPVANRVRSR